MLGYQAGSIPQVDGARGDINNEFEALIRGEVMSMSMHPKQ
ncbi:hypothetical protein [Paenarthrobacter aurescens]|nr:hypothetical protein [Paenarthrobacter aurescens]